MNSSLTMFSLGNGFEIGVAMGGTSAVESASECHGTKPNSSLVAALSTIPANGTTPPPFIAELPTEKPTAKTVLHRKHRNVKHFAFRAKTTLLERSYSIRQ